MPDLSTSSLMSPSSVPFPFSDADAVIVGDDPQGWRGRLLGILPFVTPTIVEVFWPNQVCASDAQGVSPMASEVVLTPREYRGDEIHVLL